MAYFDIDGNEVSLRELIKLQPEWAHTRIKQLEAMELEIKNELAQRKRNYGATCV